MENILNTSLAFLTVAIGVPLAGYLLSVLLVALRSDKLRERLGIERIYVIPFLIASALWGAIASVLFVGLFTLIFDILNFVPPGAGEDSAVWNFRFKLVQITAITTVLGAVIALPFTMIKLRLQTQANKTPQEGLITDRINNAIEQLGHTDPAVRMGAILQLERILRDSLEDRVLVLETLNAYIVHHQQAVSASSAPVANTPIDVQAALDVMFRHA